MTQAFLSPSVGDHDQRIHRKKCHAGSRRQGAIATRLDRYHRQASGDQRVYLLFQWRQTREACFDGTRGLGASGNVHRADTCTAEENAHPVKHFGFQKYYNTTGRVLCSVMLGGYICDSCT